MDGDYGLGPVVGIKASDLAVDKAKKHGIGVISTRKASHVGMLGYFTEHLARYHLIGICMTNSESGMAPFGSAEKVLGTNPLSIAVPSRDLPLILDMSTSVEARGKIVLALEKGEKIPENLIKQIREAKIAPGADQILLPGELEYLTKKKRLAEGIPIDEELFKMLTFLAGNATLSSTTRVGCLEGSRIAIEEFQ